MTNCAQGWRVLQENCSPAQATEPQVHKPGSKVQLRFLPEMFMMAQDSKISVMPMWVQLKVPQSYLAREPFF